MKRESQLHQDKLPHRIPFDIYRQELDSACFKVKADWNCISKENFYLISSEILLCNMLIIIIIMLYFIIYKFLISHCSFQILFRPGNKRAHFLVYFRFDHFLFFSPNTLELWRWMWDIAPVQTLWLHHVLSSSARTKYFYLWYRCYVLHENGRFVDSKPISRLHMFSLFTWVFCIEIRVIIFYCKII